MGGIIITEFCTVNSIMRDKYQASSGDWSYSDHGDEEEKEKEGEKKTTLLARVRW